MRLSVPKNSDDFSVGKVVSINNDGDLQLGGGFTLYKDVYVSHHLQARYLRVAYIGSHILVSAYNSYIQVFVLNDDLTVRKTKEVCFYLRILCSEIGEFAFWTQSR